MQQGVHGCPNSPTGVEDIIDQNDLSVLDQKVDPGFSSAQQFIPATEVVPVEGWINTAVIPANPSFEFLKLCMNTIGKVNSAGLNTNQTEIAQIAVVLHQLMRQTLGGKRKLPFVQYDSRVRQGCGRS